MGSSELGYSVMEMNIEGLAAEQQVALWTWIDFAGLGLILHIVLIVVLTLRIVSVQRNIGVAIAWIAVLFTLPIFGLIAYVLVGEPMIGGRYRERVQQARLLMNEMAQREQLVFDKGQDLLPKHYRGVSKMGTRWTGFGVFSGHQMQLLTTPNAIFRRLIGDIEGAQRSILMEFYILYPKGQILDVIQALIAAAQRGVECHILIDSVGSFSFFNCKEHKA